MRPGVTFIGFAAVTVLMACAQNVSVGRAVYHEHCIMCHGEAGHGDGEFVDKLLIPPPDLTTLTRNNGGDFPRSRVSDAITGDRRGDHLSGAMPAFSDVAGSGTIAEAKLGALLTYLESLQG
ncbi:c-type cytochrome [Shimia sediminis]|uniref:c-type cytochrome n=1 Tax=Shimia sediminis TaxID=2497945 RepID=UPI000F8CC76D|nr:c-type cytochrome [Shimia sediminis]